MPQITIQVTEEAFMKNVKVGEVVEWVHPEERSGYYGGPAWYESVVMEVHPTYLMVDWEGQPYQVMPSSIGGLRDPRESAQELLA